MDVYASFCNDVCRSADFKDFLSKCLVKDPARRSAVADLLQVSACVSLLCYVHVSWFMHSSHCGKV